VHDDANAVSDMHASMEYIVFLIVDMV
jgi:hypothetical protein